MAIYSHTTFISPLAPIPGEAVATIGIPQHPILADYLLDAIANGYTTATSHLELGAEENGLQPFTIVREWFDADRANDWVAFTTLVMSDQRYADAFVSCTIVNT